jgi:hypothetical protein
LYYIVLCCIVHRVTRIYCVQTRLHLLVFSYLQGERYPQMYFSEMQYSPLYLTRYVRGLYNSPEVKYKLFFMSWRKFEPRFDPFKRLPHVRSYTSGNSLNRFSVQKYIRIHLGYEILS